MRASMATATGNATPHTHAHTHTHTRARAHTLYMHIHTHTHACTLYMHTHTATSTGNTMVFKRISSGLRRVLHAAPGTQHLERRVLRCKTISQTKSFDAIFKKGGGVRMCVVYSCCRCDGCAGHPGIEGHRGMCVTAQHRLFNYRLVCLLYTALSLVI